MTLLAVSPAIAQSEPDVVIPADVACPGFALGIDSAGNENRVDREFYDKEGNLIRVLSTGTGPDLTLINMTTGATVSLQGNGANSRTTFNPDGTLTVVNTGHNILIMFPTDVPAGPSTTLYIGRLVYTVDPTTGVYTFVDFKGKSRDLCAALAS
jgi:hypothetical protein